MSKITSLDDLRRMRKQLEQQMNIREKSDRPESLTQIRVAMATCGIAAGARAAMNALIDRIEKDGIPAIVTQGGCMGYCYAEPTVEVTKPGREPIVFGKVSPERAMEIIDRYVLNDELVEDIIPVNYRSVEQNG